MIYILVMEENMSKNGFTLSEILITLGVIGVVAAMTLPTLIKNYKYKVLESQLKKGYSTVSQALLMMYADTGIDINYQNYPSFSFYPAFIKYLRINKSSISNILRRDGSYMSLDYMNYNNTAEANAALFDEGQMILNDNMAIYIQNSDIGNYGLFITIDVNGLNTKPNRWGHDLFSFRVENNGKLTPMADPNGTDKYRDKSAYCSKTSTAQENGIACAYYAINNICPDDSSKSYWSCLPR